MSGIAQFKDAAESLSNPEKAELAVFLLSNLENTHYWVDDQEVARRSAELDSGEVEGISRDDFRKLCGR